MSALSNLIKVVANTVNTAAKQLEDGFQVTDLFALIPIASQVPAVIADKENIKAEWKARTPQTIKDAIAEFETDLDLTNDKLEAQIEKGVEFVLAGAELYDSFKAA